MAPHSRPTPHLTRLLHGLVALTAALLLWQDKNAPRYIHIYDNEE